MNAQPSKNSNGFLELIIGPMYSGKTSTLIELYKQYTLSNMGICVINYAEDVRYDTTRMSTHDKTMIDCYNTLILKDLLEKKKELIENNKVFLINEGQFFPDLFEIVVELVETQSKIVHVCGLDGDFQRNGFTNIMKLIPLADSVVKKMSICQMCKDGTKALFSHRLSNETSVKVIGSDNYIPLCRKCYIRECEKKTHPCNTIQQET